MIKINYLNGKSWTYKDHTGYFVDGWIDWEKPSLGILDKDYFPIEDPKLTMGAYKEVLSVEDHFESGVFIWKNPKYHTALSIDIQTARSKMREHSLLAEYCHSFESPRMIGFRLDYDFQDFVASFDEVFYDG